MENVPSSVLDIRRLLVRQRSARLGVRALWLAIAGYVFARGLTQITGLDAGALTWIGAGALLALPALIAAARPLPVERLVWRMDRLLDLREQVTTAWRTATRNELPNPIELHLLEDVERLLPQSRRRIFLAGWHLRQDLQALAIVCLLLATMILFNGVNTTLVSPAASAAGLPTLAQAPGFNDVFPSGIPGLSESLPAGSGTNPAAGPAGGEVGEINNILSDLGAALSEHPETAEIGEALSNGDLEGAAAAVERTADTVDLLPDDARQDMQRAFERAAAQARDAGRQDLADDLDRAAQSLQNTDPNNPLAADALDELADGLRELGEVFGAMGQPGESNDAAPPENQPQVGSAGGQSGSGSGAGTQGAPEPLTRIEGLGQDFTIEGGENPSGLLQPGRTPGTNVTIDGGAIRAGGDSPTGPSGTINSILTPYSYSWRWRDVVSDYFSP